MKIYETKPDFKFTEWCNKNITVIGRDRWIYKLKEYKSNEIFDLYRDLIVNTIIEVTRQSLKDIRSDCRKAELVEARVLLYYFTDKWYTMNTFNKDASTVYHYRDLVESYMTDRSFKILLNRVNAIIYK